MQVKHFPKKGRPTKKWTQNLNAQACAAPVETLETDPASSPHPGPPRSPCPSQDAQEGNAVSQRSSIQTTPQSKSLSKEMDQLQLHWQAMQAQDPSMQHTPNSSQEKYCNQLRETLSSRSFATTNVNLMKRFQQDTEQDGTVIDYKKSNDKKKWRLEWAARKLKQMTVGKVHDKEWRNVNIEQGQYEPLAIIIDHQGYACDPIGAESRGMEYCKACIKLGGEWVRKNNMTKELEFFEMKHGHTHFFTEAWSLYEKNEQHGIVDAVQKEQAIDDLDTPLRRAKAKAKSTAHDQNKKQLSFLLKECTKLKSSYHKFFTAGTAMLTEIKKSTKPEQPWYKFNSTEKYSRTRERLDRSFSCVWKQRSHRKFCARFSVE